MEIVQNKKNHWIKLKTDFFQSLPIKKLRKLKNGDSYLIIYQKLMLLTSNNEGHYSFQNIENSLYEEVALLLDEQINVINLFFHACLPLKLIEYIDENTIYLSQVPLVIGKNDNSTQRVREYRDRMKQECNALHVLHETPDVTESNAPRDRVREDIELDTEVEVEKKPSETVIEYFNLVFVTRKYQDGASKADIVKHITRLIKQGETVETIKLLIDYKKSNPNTQKQDLYAWINSEYAGKNLSDAKSWQLVGRPTIPKYNPNQSKQSSHDLSQEIYTNENAEKILGVRVNQPLKWKIPGENNAK